MSTPDWVTSQLNARQAYQPKLVTSSSVANYSEDGRCTLTRNIAWLLKGTGVTVNKSDFEWLDGQWTLDGMDPYEWAEAMMQD